MSTTQGKVRYNFYLTSGRRVCKYYPFYRSPRSGVFTDRVQSQSSLLLLQRLYFLKGDGNRRETGGRVKEFAYMLGDFSLWLNTADRHTRPKDGNVGVDAEREEGE